MEVSLTTELEARLRAFAAERGISPAAIVRNLLEHAFEYEKWFLSEVGGGIDQADRGELINHEEVVKRMVKHSPFDVGGLRTDVSANEIVEIIHEDRRRGYPEE